VGRIVGRFHRGGDCSMGCSVRLLSTRLGIALIDQAGDITLVDTRGKTVATHKLPVCR
jgi:hypothetical protein